MKYSFDDLVNILKTLRSEHGCPWDKAQNVSTLLPYLIEETYEYIEAAQNSDIKHMQEELGDVLLQVVFHAQVCKEEGAFDINDVIQGISEKMIRRHPHVFGNANAEDSSAVRKQWDEIKAEENKGRLKDPSAMAKVPKGFPPLSKAQELQRRATKVGFDWKHAEDSFEKVVEEFKEFEKERQATDFPDKNRLEEEFGDILFSLINYGRHCGLNAALALSKANNKFEKRFRKMEVLAETSNLKDKTETEVLSLWEKAKGS